MWAQVAVLEQPSGSADNATKAQSVIGTAVVAVLVLVLSFAPNAVLAGSPPPDSFADLAAKVTPAVVNISSIQRVPGGPEQMVTPFDIPPGSPFEQFFKQFRDYRRSEDEKALGSGFLIDPSGYIVTNDHVIDGAIKIQVTLSDGKDMPAKLIGADKKTDLALLKVNPPKPLPTVSFGNSDAMRVGDWVLAVGNPFGLGGTVTAGIISARGRNLDNGSLEDFLQIDASINKGNSGGPTFNLDGEVIGVNTAIASPNGGSVGIAFAIPSNTVKQVIDELRRTGRVEHGWIGVGIQPVTPELASSLGLSEATGALVATVQPGSPAAAAGIQQGDVILTFDGQSVHETQELPRIVADTPPGRRVDVVVWRDGARRSLSLMVAQLKEEVAQRASADTSSGNQSSGEVTNRVLGLQLAELNDELRQQFGLAPDVRGVVVTDLDEQGAAAHQGLQQGDVIEQVSRQRVTKPEEVDRLVRQTVATNKPAVLLLVNRQGSEVFLAVKLGKT